MGDRATRNGLAILFLVLAVFIVIVAKLKERTVHLEKPPRPSAAATKESGC